MYASGVAFHHYMGDVSAMSQVHSARPDKDIYFTEQMIVGRGWLRFKEHRPEREAHAYRHSEELEPERDSVESCR